MSRLTKREKQKIKIWCEQTTGGHDRGPTWVGCRPSTFADKKKDSKRMRRRDRQMCRQYSKGR